jgi:membrane-bound metal-dependent hydrolase YbcI (DUF457 family)
MLIGHFAAFAAGRAATRRISAVVLFTAAYFPDLAEWAILLSGGSSATAEQYSHSLVVTAMGGAVLALVALRLGRTDREALMVLGVALSHLPLDWLTGTNKPLLWPYGPQVGMGLYGSPLLAAVIEAALVTAVFIWWARREPSRRRAIWLLLAALLAVQSVFTAYHTSRKFRRFTRRAVATMLRRI